MVGGRFMGFGRKDAAYSIHLAITLVCQRACAAVQVCRLMPGVMQIAVSCDKTSQSQTPFRMCAR